MTFFGCIRSDIKAKAQWLYGEATCGSMLKACCTDGTAAMILYRLMQSSQRLKLAPLAMVFNKLNAILGQCVIGRHADFGARLVFVHSQGIVINSAVKGGDDLCIEHQVTIGAEKDTAPVLGDRVFIGAGAKVLGAIKVGDDVKIGANAVVIRDVPDGATVVGIPAKVVRVYGEPPSGAGHKEAG